MFLFHSPQAEDYFCASVLSLVCCICVLIHSVIIIKILIKSKFKSPFVLLCLSRSVAHIVSSVSMTVSMAVPLFWKVGIVGYGLNVVTAPEVSLYPSELFLAFNRFVAVYYWNRYNKIFSLPVVWVLIMTSWLLGLSVLGETFWRGCILTFDTVNLQSAFSYDECWAEKTYGQIINLPSIFVSLFLNFVTLGKYVFISVKKKGFLEKLYKKDENVRLFLFAFAECLLWLLVQIVWWSQIIDSITSRIGKFFCNTMFSNGGHIVEGLIFIVVYRKELAPKHKVNAFTAVKGTASFIK